MRFSTALGKEQKFEHTNIFATASINVGQDHAYHRGPMLHRHTYHHRHRQHISFQGFHLTFHNPQHLNQMSVYIRLTLTEVQVLQSPSYKGSCKSEKRRGKVFLPSPRDLLSTLRCSVRSFSISRAMETRFFSIACFCTTCSSFDFFSYSKALLEKLCGIGQINELSIPEAIRVQRGCCPPWIFQKFNFDLKTIETCGFIPFQITYMPPLTSFLALNIK